MKLCLVTGGTSFPTPLHARNSVMGEDVIIKGYKQDRFLINTMLTTL